ncbi:MAG: ferrous iron transport protein A [Saprospiraceae bacterium]|nr:ferrous iron transport protein A [Saprospiraceae bacterium]
MLVFCVWGAIGPNKRWHHRDDKDITSYLCQPFWYILILKLEYLILKIKDPNIGIRLLSLGFYPGKTIRIIRKMPFGGSYYVQMDHSFYALSKREWQSFETQRINQP